MYVYHRDERAGDSGDLQQPALYSTHVHLQSSRVISPIPHHPRSRLNIIFVTYLSLPPKDYCYVSVSRSALSAHGVEALIYVPLN